MVKSESQEGGARTWFVKQGKIPDCVKGRLEGDLEMFRRRAERAIDEGNDNEFNRYYKLIKDIESRLG